MKTPLWSPSKEQIANSNITNFITLVSQQHSISLNNYEDLHQWSIQNVDAFWQSVWKFTNIYSSEPYTQVLQRGSKIYENKWFVNSKLNFAQNLLRYRDEQTALIFVGENQKEKTISYKNLYTQVAQLAKSLRNAGVKPGDRVAGFMPNMIETVVAMLATTSIGGVWSSCSPDFGIKGVLDRFGQIQPKILFTANGYYYNGKENDSLARVAEIVKEIPSIEKVIVVPYIQSQTVVKSIPDLCWYDDFLTKESETIEFEQLPFEHPLYIMYSSGTTGLPKCMVQSAGGILLNQLKEHILHVDLKRSDTLFYYTTCGWMMWNWLMTGLAAGATLFLYDGSPFFPHDDYLWELAEKYSISIFGTSARYITALEQKNVFPGKKYTLSKLRIILSTGSPLPEESFYYVYQHIKKNIHLASISGGTDLNGCFVGGNPISPVYPGEIQCKCLGMDIHAYNDAGKSVTLEKGELVCKSPFPSMPICFWNDPDGEKYHKAYFAIYDNIWRHGDYIEITENNGIIIYGRSDATLNPGGVRIGTAEIYRQVESFVEIEDSVVVGQEWDNDTRVILFVKMKEGFTLDNELVTKVKSLIRVNASVRHVPAKILPILDIPYTISMKKVEIAVREIINNRPVYNQDALKNPESLELYKNIPALREK